jgi:drug/metabolite transporter (DMT)-like permease
MIRIGSVTTTGYLLVVAATVIWSGNFVVARALTDTVPPVTLAFLRWLIAVLVLLPFAIRIGARNGRMVLNHLGYLCLMGFLGVTMFNTLVYIAAYSSEAFNLSVISVSSPAFVLIFARIFLGERFTLRRIVGLVMATFGVLLLLTRGQLGRLMGLTFAVGDIWMLLAAAIFAAYSILLRYKPPEMGPVAFISFTFIPGLIFLLPWLAWEHAGNVSITFSWTALGSILYLAIGPSLLSFLCWNRAVELVGPAKAAFVYYSLPLFSGSEAVILLGEPIGTVHVLSGALILCGIIVATWQHQPNKPILDPSTS